MRPSVIALLEIVLFAMICLGDLQKLFPVGESPQPLEEETLAKPPCRRVRAAWISVLPIAKRRSRRPSLQPPLRLFAFGANARAEAAHSDQLWELRFPNPDRDPHDGTDVQRHALVGYRDHGQAEPIQDICCQCSRHKFTGHRHTPHSRLKTSAALVAFMLTALAERLTPAGVIHISRKAEVPITQWLRRAVVHAQQIQCQVFQNLQLPHMLLDELRNEGHEAWRGCWRWRAR